MKVIILISLICLSFCQSSPRAQSIQYQLSQLFTKIANKTIAMLTNPTSVDSNMRPLFDRIIEQREKYNITIKCFFAPQHGLRGDRQDGKGDDDYVDKQTGIQVYSLYGSRTAPSKSQLQGVQKLIYDIQDVGARYYTYIWTLTYTIQALSQNNIGLIIFDRPNPLGRKVQGCPLNYDAGLVGRLLPGQSVTIPLRYGLTIGQLIAYLSPYLPTFQLQVIKMKSFYEITEQDWVMSSPNMPTLATVHVYAGMALLEGTAISEGRGTTKPFQLSGYPGIDAKKLVEKLKQKINTNFTYLRQSYIIPTTSKHEGQVCGGLQIMPKSVSQTFYDYNSVQTALYVIKSYIEADPTIQIKTGIDRLFGRQGFFQQIKSYSVEQIVNECKSQSSFYTNSYEKFWFYPQKSEDNLRIQ